MNKPVGNVTVAIGHVGGQWEEETFETHLTYEECNDQSLLRSEAEEIMDLGDNVAFIVMINYSSIEPKDVGKCNNCCENEAMGYYVTRSGVEFDLCGHCSDAFGLGQINPDVDVRPKNPRVRH